MNLQLLIVVLICCIFSLIYGSLAIMSCYHALQIFRIKKENEHEDEVKCGIRHQDDPNTNRHRQKDIGKLSF